MSWPAADTLFRGSPNWLGGDGAFSIDLGSGRSLWLFGDSWIDPTNRQSRRNGRMVRNSLAIQSGTDPSRAEMHFYWGTGSGGEPEAFFEAGRDEWYWPGHGIRTSGGLVLFLNRLRPASTGLGFESAGWASVLIENPDDDPPQWRVRMLKTPADSPGIQVGFASVLGYGGYVYAFGSDDPDKTHPIYASRWPLEAFSKGRLTQPESWGGHKTGWSVDGPASAREPILPNGQSEMTIHFDGPSGQFIAVQTTGFGNARLAMRASPALPGPWSSPVTIFDPPENRRRNTMIYAAKAHPQLSGADLVVTYATNTSDFSEHLADSETYYPHFVRLSRCNRR